MRPGGSALVAALGVLVALVVAAPPASATLGSPVEGPLPGHYVLVDADTGVVLAGRGEREPRPPASTIKLLTALIGTQHLAAGDRVPISKLAESMPARKINVKAGQSWTFTDLLHSMLMVSANDAAVAVAEATGGGSLEGWSALAQATADRLGLEDSPAIYDPAGLDDEFSHRGGSTISARDLAIVARAVLQRPELLKAVEIPTYRFEGGDGLNHKLTNGDLFLALYPGALGLKTGTTEKAGRTFVAAARRDGRTMLAVLFDAADPYGSAATLLDRGFAAPVATQLPRADRLPPVVVDASIPLPTTTAPVTATATAGVGRPSGPGWGFNSPEVAVMVLVLGLLPLVSLRRRALAGVPPPPFLRALAMRAWPQVPGALPGRRTRPLALAPPAGPSWPAVTERGPFEEAVAAVLDSLGHGEVVTYGEVAESAGYPGAARAVGRYLAAHGGDHPWWRVVTASGRLVPGNEADHAQRLRQETVEVRDGRVVWRSPGDPYRGG
ncbi:MAG: MGMT family protein [Acidimicrobiia bacterium]